MTDYFSHSPAQVAPGDTVRICYDFPATGPSSVTATLDYGPSSVGDDSATLTRAKPCVDKVVKNGATSLILVDGSGQSEDHDVPIS